MKDSVNKNMINKNVLFILLLALAASVFVIVYLPIFGNMPQSFNDIIYEATAYESSNISCEIFLSNFLCYAGLVLCFMYFIKNNGGLNQSKTENYDKYLDKSESFYMLPVFFTAALTHTVLCAAVERSYCLRLSLL